MKWIINLFKFIKDEQKNLCPNCGYYCHGKSVFCNPPISEE